MMVESVRLCNDWAVRIGAVPVCGRWEVPKMPPRGVLGRPGEIGSVLVAAPIAWTAFGVAAARLCRCG